MKALKIIGIVLLAIVVIVVIVAYTQPAEGHLEKSVVIDAPPAQVFRQVNSFEHFNEWSPWAKLDPDATYTYEGPARGVGAKMSWEGEKVGSGSQWIEESVPNERVRNGMSFEEYDTKYFAAYTLTPEGDGTKLTWSYDGPNEGFMGRIMWLFMKGMLSEQYEQGLQDLKTMVESQPATAGTDIREVTVTPVHYIGIHHTMSLHDMSAISDQMGQLYGQLMGAMQKAKVEMAGSPFCLYPRYDQDSMEMVCALPVPADATITDFDVTKSYEGPALKAVHKGDYHLLEQTHADLNQYIADNELQISGAPWEIYITDPATVQDTSQWITEVYYPVRK